MVEADLNALERIINNFIDNAYKYSPKNSSITINNRKAQIMTLKLILLTRVMELLLKK